MSENSDIQRLVTWLESHPGDPPPADLDPEVVEAVYLLRPDLAPAPRVGMEDIFARIKNGPLAHEDSEVTQEHLSHSPLASPNEMPPPSPMGLALQTDDIPTELALDRPDPLTETAGTGEVVELSFYRRHRRNLWTGTGTLAAAAVALFMVLPVKKQAELLGQALHESPSLSPQAQEPEPTDQPRLPPTADGMNQADVAIEATEKKKETLLKKNDEDAPGDKSLSRSLDDAALLDEREGMNEQTERPPSGARVGFGGAGGAVGGAVVGAPPPQAQEAQTESAAEFDFESEMDEREEMVASDAAPLAGIEASRTRRKGAREQRTRDSRYPAQKSSPRASAGAGVSAMADAAPALAPAEPAPVSTSDLAPWAARAQVKDYRSDWYTTVLTASVVAEVHETITLASDAGRYMGSYVPPGVASPNRGASSDPVAIYEPWIQHEDVRVAQDMAWRAADAALRQGQLDRALSLVARGRARSSANTPFYAHLLEMEGTLRKRQGDLPGALEAWKAAALLNEARSG